jgi:hypothetical protein
MIASALNWIADHWFEVMTTLGVLASVFMGLDVQYGLRAKIKIHTPRLYHLGEAVVYAAPVFLMVARKLVGVWSPKLLAKIEAKSHGK